MPPMEILCTSYRNMTHSNQSLMANTSAWMDGVPLRVCQYQGNKELQLQSQGNMRKPPRLVIMDPISLNIKFVKYSSISWIISVLNYLPFLNAQFSLEHAQLWEAPGDKEHHCQPFHQFCLLVEAAVFYIHVIELLVICRCFLFCQFEQQCFCNSVIPTVFASWHLYLNFLQKRVIFAEFLDQVHCHYKPGAGKYLHPNLLHCPS